MADTETEQGRLARNMGELLQELRVAQAGVQILFAFLLSVAFSAGFERAGTYERIIAVVTVLLTAASSACLIAPAAWHRLYFRQGRRELILRWANRATLAGFALLAGAMTGAVLLFGTSVLGRTAGIVLAAGVFVLFGLLWFALPLTHHRLGAGEHEPPES